MPVIALTGNYGMGKSTVAGLFSEAGAVTLDLDDVVDELLREDAVIEEIRRVFGERVFSEKGLDRSRVAEIVFSDKEKRELLERLLHPLVIERMKKFISKTDRRKVIIVEIPLLFEKGYENEFDMTITVYTDIETTLERLEKKGIKRDHALMRLQAQMPVDEKIKRSDLVINNSGTIEETQRQVMKIYERIKT